MNVLDAYAQSVVDGQVPAGKFHRLACARHMRDRAREGTPDFPYRFDLARAERFFVFAALLKHYKGEWAGQRIHLEPWEQFITGSVIGWVHVETGLRRFRTAFTEIPRKNGKTLLAAIVVLYLAFFDQEAGAEGYSVATKREQAKLVFNDAKQLVQSSGLKDRIQVLKSKLHRDVSASKFEPLGADHDSTDGLNPHVVIVDEMHAMKDRGMLDVMETATGARRQPVHFQITTAGDDPVSPCGDQHDYACKILDGMLEDESFFAFIAHADPEDVWTDEATWAKANPNFGVSVKPDDLRALAVKAQNMPAAAAAFQQKRLNLWVNTDAPWLSVDGWRAGQSTWDWRDLLGHRCWIGIDLSSKIDLTAVVLVFPWAEKQWRLLVWALTPEETLRDRAHRDRAPYDRWRRPEVSAAAAGSGLRTNPGNRIDQGVVREWVRVAKGLFLVQAVGVDPWNAGNLLADLEADGVPVVEIPQTLQQMSAQSKDFEADVLDGLVDAGGDPLMRWCISNAVVQRDGKDNIYPVKKKSRGRIDPVIAALMARKLATMAQTPPPVFQLIVLGGTPTHG